MNANGYVFGKLTGNKRDEELRLDRTSVVLTLEYHETKEKFQAELKPGELLAEWKFHATPEFPAIGPHNYLDHLKAVEPTRVWIRAVWEELLTLEVDNYGDYIVL